MGHTLTEWTDQIEHLVRDAGNTDVSTTQVQAVGITPALSQFSADRPYQDVAETAGAGTSYLDLPAEWVDGFSRLVSIEYPARQNPPEYLDETTFTVVRDPATVATKVILLTTVMPTASEWVRIEYTRPWPTPTATASVDKVNDVAFSAVTALAASYVLEHLASQAARRRDGALPSDWAGGSERARDLHNIARGYRDIYDAFMGRGAGGASSSAAPVSRRFDYDPGYHTLFHGGRR